MPIVFDQVEGVVQRAGGSEEEASGEGAALESNESSSVALRELMQRLMQVERRRARLIAD